MSDTSLFQLVSAARAALTGLGAIIGVISALMSILTGWLADYRLGHCTNGWYLGRKFCCLEIAEDGGCDEWHDWGSFPPLPWLAYIFFAVSYTARIHN